MLLRVAAKVENPELNFQQSFKAAATRVDRDTPITNIMLFDQLLENITAFALFASDLFSFIAMITLFIAGCGIYGIMSRSVIRRTLEIGIRRALGATNSNTVNVFLREGAITLLIGLVIGGIPAILAIVGIAGVLPFMLDYLMIIGPMAVAIISVTILTASYWPARKLTALEPGDALQCN